MLAGGAWCWGMQSGAITIQSCQVTILFLPSGKPGCCRTPGKFTINFLCSSSLKKTLTLGRR